ncbi:MAG: ATP-binding cassette domain-containing protein [Syntrophomonadaceae bacterium]|nr:ATP-binding cassette domain-containing protein [Syntrophomonadaceae bacterium]
MLKAKGLDKKYGRQTVLQQASLEVNSEIKALIGINGSGKSTFLKIVAGIVNPDGGQVLINQRDVTGLPPEFRHVGYVPQHPALFQHLTVKDNVLYGLRKDAKTEYTKVIEMLGLQDVLHKRPHELSGGYKSRASLARALVPQPQILLMDEPLTGMDVVLKERILPDFRRVLKELQVPVLYITHDPKEAELLSDSYAVIDNGKIHSVDTWKEAFDMIHTSILQAYSC